MSRKWNLNLLLLLLLLTIIIKTSSSYSVGSRSILRELDKSYRHVESDRAVELNATNFDQAFIETSTNFAVVEFFAHWCPACRNFKAHYEKVAKLFNGPDAVHPNIVLMTRVDCALKINNKLCDKFSVAHYPMLFWGPSSKFVSASWDPNQEKTELKVIDDGRTAERLLDWINKQLSSSYALEDKKFHNEYIALNVSDPGQIARAVHDVEEATAIAFHIILQHKMIKSETRPSFIKFLQLIAAHHPSKRCRKGSANLLVDLGDFFPLDKREVIVDNGKIAALGNFHICGEDIPRGHWMFCRGSKNETRGLSCGLWVLLHSLSVRIEDGESQFAFVSAGQAEPSWLELHVGWVSFGGLSKSQSKPDPSGVTRPFIKSRDFVLWLWDAHNSVNERLMKVEAALQTADPLFPKVIWPPRQLCPACYIGSGRNWNRDDVYRFLTGYYGKTFISTDKEKRLLEKEVVLEDSTDSYSVPASAALAIAFASFAFAAVACYWRSNQKTRKYFHLHLFKNI
ncbi:hypothetical protein ACFE04_017145 [Oxalis oulophora]